MASPFRYRKKARKRWRKIAKRSEKLANELEVRGASPDWVASSRRSAESLQKLSRSQRKKKQKCR
jgi:hypothetical protein